MTHTTQGSFTEARAAVEAGGQATIPNRKGDGILYLKICQFSGLALAHWPNNCHNALPFLATDLDRTDYQITWPEPDWKEVCRGIANYYQGYHQKGAVTSDFLSEWLNKPEIQALLKDGEAE